MDGYVRIGTELDTKNFDAEIKYVESQLEEIEHKLKQADMGFEVGDTQKLEAQYSKLIKQLDRLQKKQAELNRTDLSGIQKNIDKVGSSVSKTISKVGRWALAVFGVRSAYMFVRQSASTLAQYNEQIASDLEYMRFALASSLQPLIEGLINLAYKLLTYVNYIAQAWFGVNLFANASAKAMQKGASSAEKMKKSLSGFDEMNVINENGSVGALGGLPSVDLSKMQGEVPSWIKWIADNKDLVISALIGIASGLTAISLGLSAVKGFGVAVAIAGITYAIINLIKFLQDPTFNNFINTIIGIGVAITGVGVIIGSLPVAITGAVIAIVALVVKNYDYIMGLFDKAIKWLEGNFVNSLRRIFGPLGDIITTPIIFAVNYLKGSFEGFYGGIKKIVDGIVKLFKGDFKGGITSVFSGLKSIMLAPINALITGINSLIRGINKISFDVPDWVPGIGGKKWGFKIPQIPKLAKGTIVNNPGRGVWTPDGRAIYGEAGAEAYLPLSDTQLLEQLGSTIGKYITINANITNTMNGRVISREIQKINEESDFAFNR